MKTVMPSEPLSTERSNGEQTPLLNQSSKRTNTTRESQPAHDRDINVLWDDIKNLNEGSIPQSVVVGVVISITCGVAAYIYYQILFGLIDAIWHKLPTYLIATYTIPTSYHVIWIPIVTYTLSILNGLTVILVGEPGDLAYTISRVHHKAYVPPSHVPPMVLASIFSIVAGASLGPEAPLVAICAAIGGYVSRVWFRQTNRNVIRKHTLMGMAGVLAAFFGAPLGGSLFALEVCSRFGVEYFEHMIESIGCGVLTLGVFRTLTGMDLGAIWHLSDVKVDDASVSLLWVGMGIGLCGALVGVMFTHGHFAVMSVFDRLGLLDNRYAVPRALLGATVMVVIGMFVPQTMFWGEEEFQEIATLSPASHLTHVFPTYGLINFEMNSFWTCITVGLLKIVVISFSVAGGFRGGFIFPFFAAGGAFGRALTFIFPSLSPSVACLCFAAGINVSITKTSLATTIILMKLSGEIALLPIILAASLTSLFATSYMPFIKTQIAREDIDQSLSYDSDSSDNEAPSLPDQVSSMRRGSGIGRSSMRGRRMSSFKLGGVIDQNVDLQRELVSFASERIGYRGRTAQIRYDTNSNLSNLKLFSQRGFIV